MPTNKSRMVLKTALLAPVGPIEAWGVQQLVAGDPVAGGVSMLIGAVFVATFVAFQEYDLPYESEIISVIEANSENLDAEDVQAVSEDVADLTAEMLKQDEDIESLIGQTQDASDDDSEA